MDDGDRQIAAAMARGDLYFYARYMFLQRRKYNWRRAAHHKIVCAALERVFSGDCRQLIINIPPRYSKTELVAVNFITWALGRVPDAEFIYTSYSGHLATQAAWQAREIVSSKRYSQAPSSGPIVRQSMSGARLPVAVSTLLAQLAQLPATELAKCVSNLAAP